MLIRYLDYKETKYIFAPQFKKAEKPFRSLRDSIITIYCGVEQLVARWAHNPKVIGSSAVPATTADSFIESAFLFLHVFSFYSPFFPLNICKASNNRNKCVIFAPSNKAKNAKWQT